MHKIEAWTDGSCHAGDRVGGWAALLRFDGTESFWPIGGYAHDTTSQRMELMALIGVLGSVSKRCEFVVHSDSAYLINCIHQKWIEKWNANGWKNSKGGDVSNKDLWVAIDSAIKFHEVKFVKVKGHSGIHLNERVDGLARAQRELGLANQPSSRQQA